MWSEKDDVVYLEGLEDIVQCALLSQTRRYFRMQRFELGRFKTNVDEKLPEFANWIDDIFHQNNADPVEINAAWLGCPTKLTALTWPCIFG